jgi:hypothetical protein
MIISDGWEGSAVVSDGAPAPLPLPYNGDVPCDSGFCGGGCSDCDGHACDGCAPCNDYPTCEPCCQQRTCSGWFGAEYILWSLDGNDLPPLVTAGPVGVPGAGLLNDPNTFILAGNETVNDDWRDGYRVFGGFWFDCCHTWGIGADYFDMCDDDFNFLSPQDPAIIVGRPFFNTELGIDDLELVSVPGELDGTAEVRSSDDFKGAGITLSHRVWSCCDPCTCSSAGLTLLGGYRWYKYDSDLSITERLTVLPGTTTPLVPGTTFFVEDEFSTESEFHGGEIGMQAYKTHRWFWLDGMGKLALGGQRSTVTVDGTTFINVPGGGTFLAEGGLLTSEVTNIGRYDDTDFVVIPEFRLGVGACVTQFCSVRAGYNCIIWGDVARAADHLPPGLRVDPRNLPPVQPGGGPDPEFPGVSGSQLVAHGLDASIMFQW